LSKTLEQTHRDDLSTPPSSTRREPALYVVLEGERPLSGGLRASLTNIREVVFARAERGAERTWSVEEGVATLRVPDPRMSGRHARLVKENTGWFVEDQGSTNGTFVAGTRTDRAQLTAEAQITLGATVLLFEPDEPSPDATKPFVDAPSQKARPRGTATIVPNVEAQMPRIVRVAMSKLSILLLGESGVGKEVLARSIHTLSGRTGDFVAINCGALTPNLVESQLFGYVKGAFSGAIKDEPGLVRAASGGTLFLDEIGELPPPAQATLLRVLQEREVLPVGGTKPVPVDLRVVAATLKPIENSDTFRQDLYARVAAFVHRIPALRERRGDLGLLVADLLPRIDADRAAAVRIAPDLANALVSHPWPLNVRGLEHVLSVALVTAAGDLLKLDDVRDALQPARASEPPPPSRPGTETGEVPIKSDRELTREELSLKEQLTGELARTKGNVSEVARVMGKTRMQIHRWMKRFGLEPESFRG
jgi:DNA-binding NtrC family response regulator